MFCSLSTELFEYNIIELSVALGKGQQCELSEGKARLSAPTAARKVPKTQWVAGLSQHFPWITWGQATPLHDGWNSKHGNGLHAEPSLCIVGYITKFYQSRFHFIATFLLMNNYKLFLPHGINCEVPCVSQRISHPFLLFSIVTIYPRFCAIS